MALKAKERNSAASHTLRSSCEAPSLYTVRGLQEWAAEVELCRGLAVDYCMVDKLRHASLRTGGALCRFWARVCGGFERLSFERFKVY